MAVFDNTDDITNLGIPANNPDPSSIIDTAYISQMTPQGYAPIGEYEQQLIDNANRQYLPQEIGAQGISSLYPGINQPINVGTSSGQITGSHGVYVPSGNITAIDPVLARRKALDDAARLRASQLKPFDYQKPKALTDARFQQKYNESVFGFQDNLIQEAKKKYGPDFATILKDPNTDLGRKFIQGMANYETVAKNFDQIVGKMAEIDKGLQDKTKVYSPETMKIYNEFKTLVGNFDKGDVFASKDLESMYNKLEGRRSFEDYIQKDNFLKDFQAKVSQTVGMDDKGGYYDLVTKKTLTYEDAINKAVESLAEQDFALEIQQGFYTKDEMKRALKARLQDQVIRERDIEQKTKATLENEGASDINPWQEGVSVNTYSGDAPKNVQYYNYDPKTGRRETQFGLDVVKDYNISVKGKKQTINERTSEGKFIQQESRGIPISGLEVKTAQGVRTIPGTALVEFYTMRKDKNGDVYQDAKAWIPTKIPAVDSKGKPIKKEGEQVYTDGYTVEEVPVLIYEAGEGGTGTATKIQNSIKDSEQRKNYMEGFKNMTSEGKPQKSEPSGGKTTTSDPLGLF